MSALELNYTRTGKAGTIQVFAYAGGELIHVEKLDAGRSTSRARFVQAVRAVRPEIPAADIDRELQRIAVELSQPAGECENVRSAPPVEIPEEARAAALAMLRDPELIRVVVDDVAALGVAGERTLAATIYLVGTSRLLTKPLACIMQGLTSSGKSYVIDAVARLFPPETIIRAHKMTPEALVHMPAGALVHRFVVGGERSRRQDDETADATRSLREMLSDGRLTKLIPTKMPDGTIETLTIDQPGPIAYIESTTLQRILDEDRNRCVVVNTDETPEQTRRIIRLLAERKATGAAPEAETIIGKHHAAQRLLKRCRILIPYAQRLGELFPYQRTDARRAFGHLLGMIEAVALLYQYQRVDHPADDAQILATPDDYKLARYLLAEPMVRTQSGGLSNAARRFYERLRSSGLQDFTAADVAKRESIIGDIQTIRDYIRVLASSGYLEVVEERRGNRPGVYRLVADPPDDAAVAGLPTVAEVCGQEGGDSRPRRRVEAQVAADN